MILDLSTYGWPQFVMIGMYILHFIMASINHGRQKTGAYNIFSSIIGIIIGVFILTKGGFF